MPGEVFTRCLKIVPLITLLGPILEYTTSADPRFQLAKKSVQVWRRPKSEIARQNKPLPRFIPTARAAPLLGDTELPRIFWPAPQFFERVSHSSAQFHAVFDRNELARTTFGSELPTRSNRPSAVTLRQKLPAANALWPSTLQVWLSPGLSVPRTV